MRSFVPRATIALLLALAPLVQAQAPAPASGSPAAPKPDVGAAKQAIAEATQAADQGDLQKALDALENAQERLRESLPFALRQTVLVQNPADALGVYEVRTTPFKGQDPIYIYTEPANFAITSEKDGKFGVKLDGDIELQAPDGRTLLKKPAFFTLDLDSRHRLREIFVTASLSVASAPPGDYKVLLRLRDAKGQVAEASVPIKFQ